MNIEIVEAIFGFIGGLGMFIYGMNTMADGLNKAAGEKTKKLFKWLTNNRFLAVIVGALITAIIQSSSATTVLVVGFVNAGIMNLTQAVGVIMGANIGTTVTAWLVSMSELGGLLKPEFYAPLFIGFGAFMLMFAKKEGKKDVAEIIIGFGFLFIGLSLMSGAIKPYREAPIFSQAFTVLGKNPLLGILTGAIVTAIIQSSSASVGILQTLAMNGVVNWNSAIFITLGQNIGTCITALLSSIGANKTAKRAAVIHLLFNTIGAIIFGTIMFIIFKVNSSLAASTISSVQISIFHTVFNVTNTILLFPFANKLVKLSGIFVKEDEKDNENTEKTSGHHSVSEIGTALDSRLLENTAFAIQNTANQVQHMAEFTLENVKRSMLALENGDKALIDEIYECEKIINEREKALTDYIVKIDTSSLTQLQHTHIKNMLYAISDIERIGDHCENIADLAKQKIDETVTFSKEGIDDLKIITECMYLSVENAIEAWKNDNIEAAKATRFFENRVDELEEKLREKHIARLSKQICNTQSGVIFLDVISNMERISDHAVNIAEYIPQIIKLNAAKA